MRKLNRTQHQLQQLFSRINLSFLILLYSFQLQLGAQPPLGFFDPLGLLEDADQERFDRLRYVEVKHGRICQLVSSFWLFSSLFLCALFVLFAVSAFLRIHV